MSNFILSLRFLLILFLLFSVKSFSAMVTDAGFPGGIRGDGEPSVLSPPQLRKTSSFMPMVVSEERFPSEADLSSIGDGTSPSPEHLRHSRGDVDVVPKPQAQESADQPISASINSGGETIDGKRQRILSSLQHKDIHERPESSPSPDNRKRKQRMFSDFVTLNPLDIKTLEDKEGILTNELFFRVKQTHCITLGWPELAEHLLDKVSSGKILRVSNWEIYQFILTNSYSDVITPPLAASVLAALQTETEQAHFKLGTEDVRALGKLSRTLGGFPKDVATHFARYLTLGRFHSIDSLWDFGNLILDSSLDDPTKIQVITFLIDYQKKINSSTIKIRETLLNAREKELTDFLNDRLKEVYFGTEELGTSRRILELLKHDSSYETLVEILISRIKTASLTRRMISHSLKDLFSATSHREFARQFMADHRDKYSDPERDVYYARLWDGDVKVLIEILDHSSELRGEAFDLAENVYLGRLNHSRTIRLQEAMIRHAPTSRKRDKMLDEMRYKYVEHLRDNYAFKVEDVELLNNVNSGLGCGILWMVYGF